MPLTKSPGPLEKSEAQRMLIDAIGSHKAILVRTPGVSGEMKAFKIIDGNKTQDTMNWPFAYQLGAEKRESDGTSTYSRRHTGQLHHGGYLFTDLLGNVFYSTLSAIDEYALGDILQASGSVIHTENRWQNPYLHGAQDVQFEDEEKQEEWKMMASWRRLDTIQREKASKTTGSSLFAPGVIREIRESIIRTGIFGPDVV